jgi:SAM-dependent methyltransferase
LIETLPRVVEDRPDKPDLAGPDHPMRKVTRQVAFEPGGWTPERARKVAELFNGLAPEWHKRLSEGRMEALADALARGGAKRGRCVELGSGTGAGTQELTTHFDVVIALDLAIEMLKRASPDWGHRVLGDAAHLPLRSASADAIVLVNALLFPDEVNRVLAPGGVVIWVNSLGAGTPIHLAPDDVAKALPGEWNGVAAEAGWGLWCALRRAGD